jgi:hypothetical protein
MDDRTYGNVASIFAEVTGIKGSTLRDSDKATIDFWTRSHGWKEYEFRLALEHEWNTASSRAWLTAEPGRLNIRTFLNPKSADRKLSIVEDLKSLAQLSKHSSSAASSTPDVVTNRIRCQCGAVIEHSFLKVPTGLTGKDQPKHRWVDSGRLPFEAHAKHAHENNLDLHLA